MEVVRVLSVMRVNRLTVRRNDREKDVEEEVSHYTE